MSEYYGASLAQSSVRLAIVGILHQVNALLGWTVAWLGSLGLALQGTLYKRAASRLIVEPQTADPVKLKEMMSYLAPLWPGIIYYGFQGQLTIGLITIFGKTSSIAEVAALGRLAQLFMLLNAMNGVLIEPYIAKIHRRSLASRYLMILASCTAICVVLCLLAKFWPDPLMWLIGPKYSQLRPYLVFVILSASISYLSGVMFMMHNARRWIWWKASILCTITVALADGLQVIFTDLSTTASMVRLSLVTASVTFVVIAATGIYGFRQPEVVE